MKRSLLRLTVAGLQLMCCLALLNLSSPSGAAFDSCSACDTNYQPCVSNCEAIGGWPYEVSACIAGCGYQYTACVQTHCPGQGGNPPPGGDPVRGACRQACDTADFFTPCQSEPDPEACEIAARDACRVGCQL